MRAATAIRGFDRRLWLTLPAVGCAVLLAACGSSNNPGNASSASRASYSAGLRFADCMRSHGVTNFPDPPSGGGGIQITPGSGINPQSPAFQSAQNACAKLMPGPGALHGHGSEARKLELLHLAQCMRRHGISAFPDPSTSPPSGPPSGGGIAFGSPGSFLSVPQTIMQSPGFQQAAAACGFPGRGRPPKGAKLG
jgi:hypothetical protein